MLVIFIINKMVCVSGKYISVSHYNGLQVICRQNNTVYPPNSIHNIIIFIIIFVANIFTPS